MAAHFKRHLFCQNPIYNCGVIGVESWTKSHIFAVIFAASTGPHPRWRRKPCNGLFHETKCLAPHLSPLHVQISAVSSWRSCKRSWPPTAPRPWCSVSICRSWRRFSCRLDRSSTRCRIEDQSNWSLFEKCNTCNLVFERGWHSW